MPKKKHSPKQIIAKLREAEIGLAKGATTPLVCKKKRGSLRPKKRGSGPQGCTLSTS